MIVKAEELTVAFGGVEVLSNVSFSAEKGEYICIAGRNGFRQKYADQKSFRSGA